MTVILQVSDTHFGTEVSAVVSALRELVKQQRPDVLIASGDITQRAFRVQFAAAARFFQSLPVPVQLIVPGNHDLPVWNVFARVFAPYANYRHAFGAELAPQYHSDELKVICVNTTRAWRRVDGEVSPEQVAQVAQQLRCASRRQLRIVVTHQPIHVVRERDAKNRLHGYWQALSVWAREGADLILGGHIHLPYVCNVKEQAAALARNVWVVQAGTAVSSRVRWEAPNSVNIIRYEPAPQVSCVVERWDMDTSSGAFMMKMRHPLMIERS